MRNINLTKAERNLILVMFCPWIFNLFLLHFFAKEIKIDVYLFYEHERYLDNIIKDIQGLFTTTVLTYIISRCNSFAKPFFYVSLLDWFLYFLIYKQFASFIELPVLILLIMLWILKKKNT